MPVIRYVPQDPTDMVLQGEQLRQSVGDTDYSVLNPSVMGGSPLMNPLLNILKDEDAFAPMNSYCEVGMLNVRRSKDGVLRPRANAGIATPCGAWINIDYNPLLLYKVGGYEQYFLSGVSRDSSGTALANCTVKIFRTINDTKMWELTSAADGTWSIQVSEPGPFYYVEYKVGPPDKAGTSINTNVPSKVN